MNYNPHIHHRRSIRLQNYDYSQQGLYFVTICTQDRICRFGEIVQVGAGSARPFTSTAPVPQMILNKHGQIVEQCYLELEQKYPNVQCGEYIIMPNHFHAIIMIGEWGNNGDGGDDLAGNGDDSAGNGDDLVGNGDDLAGRPRPYEVTLGRIMAYFKYQSTKLIDLKHQKLWQRNYYEHIIRDNIAYQNISNYIQNNPAKWNDDKFRC